MTNIVIDASVESPFKKGKRSMRVTLCTNYVTREYKGVKLRVPQAFYHCTETERDFTTTQLDEFNHSVTLLIFKELQETL